MTDKPDLKAKLLEAATIIAGIVKMFREQSVCADEAMRAAMCLYQNETCPHHAQQNLGFDPNNPESVCELLKQASVPWGVANEAAAMLEEQSS